VTLWPVEDISTCLLMQDFYQRLRNGEPPPAAALRGAQNRLRTMDAAGTAAALAALPAALAEPSAPPGGSAGSARDTLDEDLQNEVRIRAGERSPDYRHPRNGRRLCS
jgi:CHAT domain-containing protein